MVVSNKRLINSPQPHKRQQHIATITPPLTPSSPLSAEEQLKDKPLPGRDDKSGIERVL